MSPEQARGEARRLDRRSDVYSLGATLYDILSGKPPFEDQTVLNILLKVMNEPPTPLRNLIPDLPESIELVVSKCLNKEPEQRYQTAHALAEDLGRYLTAQQVTAKRLSYSYRLRYWARHNRTLATLGAVLFVTVISATGFGIRARIIAVQKERRAKEHAELSRWIGQTVKDLEWVARTAYLLPLHDTSYEQQLVRERMAEIETELAKHTDVGPRLGAYARGRGLLALHDFRRAHEELQRAEQLGHVDPELDYAIGRALGALYSQALDDARKSGDKSFFEKRKAELDEQLLRPALSYLGKSRGLRSVSSTYVEGLVAYYQEQYDLALQSADRAYQQAPWLYEAVQLGGDVFLSRARTERDRGQHDQAEKSFAESVSRYKKAAEIGRSDHNVHEALAETYIRWEEMDYFRGKNPEAKLQEALAAADRALLAAPKESHGHTKKAFAYDFMAQYEQRKGSRESAVKYRKMQLEEAKQAISLNQNNPYAHESAGIASFRLAELSDPVTEQHREYAYHRFKAAIQINPRFPWAFNDHAIALLGEAKILHQQNLDPIDAITRSIQLAEQALAVDPGYIYALNTITAASLRACTWNVEHGVDPEVWVERGKKAAQQALSINKNYSFAHGNLGTIYMNKSLYNLLKESDITISKKTAIDSYQKMAQITGPTAELSSYISTIHHFESQQLLWIGQDPSPSIDAGLAEIASCIASPEPDPYCIDVQARLLSARYAWHNQQRINDIRMIAHAYQLSRQALSKIGDEPDALLSSGEIALQLAQATPPLVKSQRTTLHEGIGSIDRALAASPGWPRALVVKGALLLERSKLERSLLQKRASLSAARDALAAGITGNPLLKRRYEGMLKEVEQRLLE
jgi:tetratricopeptide (TPR) repeat protein